MIFDDVAIILQGYSVDDKQMEELVRYYKNNGFKPLKDDKWNPGDVWAIEKGLDLKKEIDVSSVGALNKSIMVLFAERRLVGISLKGPVKKYPPYNKVYNLRQPPESPNHKFGFQHRKQII